MRATETRRRTPTCSRRAAVAPERRQLPLASARQPRASSRRGKSRDGYVAARTQLEAGLPPLPDKLTPHSLRRTFCSLLYALGEDPGVVMDEMGHTDPGLALRVYRQAMRRGEDEKAALRALAEGYGVAVDRAAATSSVQAPSR